MTDRTLLIDDHRLLAESLALVLSQRGVQLEHLDPQPFPTLVERAHALAPDLVLLDGDLGGGHDGTRYIRPLRATGARVVMLTGSRDEIALARALEAGAHGIIDKAWSLEQLQHRIEAAARGAEVTPAPVRQRLLGELRARRAGHARRRGPFEALSTREQEVLRALVSGEPVERIARGSYVSVATVRTQVRAILRKLGVTSQLEAVALARSCGWPDRRVPARAS